MNIRKLVQRLEKIESKCKGEAAELCFDLINELIEIDLEMEMKGHIDLKSAISDCEQVNDYVSRDLLEEILESEEEHVDHLETQLELVQRVGNENFLQSLISA